MSEAERRSFQGICASPRARIYGAVTGAYGELMGYARLRIRREAADNASKTPAELAEYADRLFQTRVHDAIRRFPAYAEKVRAWRGALPAHGTRIGLAELPVWTREDQNALFAELVEPPAPRSFVHSTGGSTGVPVRFHVTRESYEWRCAVSARAYAWAGAFEGEAAFYVWSTDAMALPPAARLKRRLHNALLNRFFFDSFQFDDARKALCCRLIDRKRPRAIVGYSGPLAALARFVKANPGVLTWRPAVVIGAAEGIMAGDRELIEEQLGGELFMSYGSREFMLVGMECGLHCGYHVSADNVMVEVVDAQGRPCAPGAEGRILITDLRNVAAPFIRYEIGDLGMMDDNAAPCECGLPFPLILSVCGRLQEVVYTSRGDVVAALFAPHALKEHRWVAGYQLVQDFPGEVTLRIMPGREPRPDETANVLGMLRRMLGGKMCIRLELVAELEKNAAGKTPRVISRVARRALS